MSVEAGSGVEGSQPRKNTTRDTITTEDTRSGIATPCFDTLGFPCTNPVFHVHIRQVCTQMRPPAAAEAFHPPNAPIAAIRAPSFRGFPPHPDLPSERHILASARSFTGEEVPKLITLSEPTPYNPVAFARASKWLCVCKVSRTLLTPTNSYNRYCRASVTKVSCGDGTSARVTCPGALFKGSLKRRWDQARVGTNRTPPVPCRRALSPREPVLSE